MNVKKFVGICLKRLRSRVMPRNTSEKANMLINRLTRGQLSPLDAQRNVRGYPGIVNDFQSCPKRCLLMLLARVGARTNSTTRAATTRGVVNFRARVLAYVQYAPRVCTLVLFFSLLGLCPKLKNEWNKWKNNFSEMKGDVGMSCHLMKKKGNKKMPTQRQKVIQPHPYIFVSFSL